MKKKNLIYEGLTFLDNPLIRRPKVSKAMVDFYKENPQLLEDITSRIKLKRKFYIIGFLAALGFIIGSKIIGHFTQNLLSELGNEVLKDTLFEFGVAILGGVATTLFLRTMEKIQYDENLRLKREIIRLIEQDESIESEPEDFVD